MTPFSADTHVRMANAMLEMGKTADAAAAYQAALRIAPEHAQAWNNLGSAQAALRMLPEAEASFRRAAQLNPRYFQALSNLANAVADAGRYNEAVDWCRQALAIRPDDAAMRFLLAAVTGDNAPATAPLSYVAVMFESYAHDFDAQLVGKLIYCGPQMLRGAIGDAAKALDILDLGCGTGLCALAVRDLARTLTGVDLSPQMLEQARARRIFDRLIQGDVREALTSMSAAFDLIISADVFTYVGDLAPIFPAARRTLRQGGRFAFVVEDHAGTGFLLRPSRRYAHSAEYIRNLAAPAGFTMGTMNRAVLRVEHGHGIDGAVYVLETTERGVNA
jgi:predicted TPR repeat methyltransferase